MIYPHIGDTIVEAWVVCGKCNGAKHRVLPGKDTPFWWCQDEANRLEPGQEIEVEYSEPLIGEELLAG